MFPIGQGPTGTGENFDKVNPYHKYQAFSLAKMLGEKIIQ